MSPMLFRAPSPTRRSQSLSAFRLLDARPCVREWPGRYEDEGSERIARGAMSVAHDGWWSATLSVPMRATDAGDLPVMIRLARLGPNPETAGTAEVVIQVTMLELDAVVALLGGVVAQARRDGVLPAA